jgi:hypothetical protein
VKIKELIVGLHFCFLFFQALKVLHNSSEFLPFVIYLCAPRLTDTTTATVTTTTTTTVAETDVDGIDEVSTNSQFDNGQSTNWHSTMESLQLNHYNRKSTFNVRCLIAIIGILQLSDNFTIDNRHLTIVIWCLTFDVRHSIRTIDN